MADNNKHPADLYAAIRDELIEGLRDLDSDSAASPVPGCPSWSVKDVVAHLCGLNAELIAGVPGRLGTDEATSRQVTDRASLDLDRVLNEWESLSNAIDQHFRADKPKAVDLLTDLVVHVYDIAEGHDLPTTVAATATPLAAHRYISPLQERVADVLDIALTVELDDGTSTKPETNKALQVTVGASPYKFLRGVTGRLTRSEVEAFTWSSDPTKILDHAWIQYGPFRTE